MGVRKPLFEILGAAPELPRAPKQRPRNPFFGEKGSQKLVQEHSGTATAWEKSKTSKMVTMSMKTVDLGRRIGPKIDQNG